MKRLMRLAFPEVQLVQLIVRTVIDKLMGTPGARLAGAQTSDASPAQDDSFAPGTRLRPLDL
jgi:hypothetical protein